MYKILTENISNEDFQNEIKIENEWDNFKNNLTLNTALVSKEK